MVPYNADIERKLFCTWNQKNFSGKRPGTYHDIIDNNSDIKIFPNGSLIIEKLGEEHEGYYVCEAFNGIGTGLSKRIYLTVNGQFNFKF